MNNDTSKSGTRTTLDIRPDGVDCSKSISFFAPWKPSIEPSSVTS